MNGGTSRAAKLTTDEQRSEIARVAGQARWDLFIVRMNAVPMQRIVSERYGVANHLFSALHQILVRDVAPV